MRKSQVQQRPGRGEKARDARSWGRFFQAGLKNPRQELGAGGRGVRCRELCTACLASLTPLFLCLCSLSLSPISRKHLISIHNLALDLHSLSLSLARFSSSTNSISLPNSEYFPFLSLCHSSSTLPVSLVPLPSPLSLSFCLHLTLSFISFRECSALLLMSLVFLSWGHWVDHLIDISY